MKNRPIFKDEFLIESEEETAEMSIKVAKQVPIDLKILQMPHGLQAKLF